MRAFLPCPYVAAICLTLAPLARAQKSPVEQLIPWLLDEKEALKGIPFAEVVAATSGKKVLPFNPADPDQQRIVRGISGALDEVLRKMNAPDNPAKNVPRVNEISSHFETLMKSSLEAVPDFSCDFPPTTAGRVQRSGYPDLRLVDQKTGRICYLDPKLYAKGSRDSSFRTFYFEPKRETNKVNDDAHHFIVGIEHERGETGWRFLRWELIDLSGFRVKLKAEFEGSNRDMYRPEAIISQSAE